ncbi:hypothetical protein Pyrfu_1229 [Pyrolobus fumarii 1A]|uniref:DUF4352 domain-containing protein n=1 Tax=Pyrolobus fumarii (strain DSM 11204 / 1A) TaxID=694429 RepID=G0EFY8_PYRF1|nr:DUF4352 domain-containing protein [Pyrolobus fumarii]AEM39089.1 hypothetical protein Pyrfu_1229 [Pyrolobus fumarii 1A]
METAASILLFIMGLFLVLLVFPVAFYASAALGYLLGLVALGIGAYLIFKRGGRILPAVLGVMLSAAAIIALGGTALIHMSVYVAKEAVEEAAEMLQNTTRTRSLSGVVGESLQVNDWAIKVEEVRETTSILYDSTLYKAKPGYKIVVVRLRVENTGGDVKHLTELWGYTLVTNSNKSYDSIYPLELELVWNLTPKDKAEAIKVKQVSGATTLPPGAHTEYDILFQIPSNENPQKLVIRIGFVGGYLVTIKLTR